MNRINGFNIFTGFQFFMNLYNDVMKIESVYLEKRFKLSDGNHFLTE